jgi:hypothetical protein
MEELLVRIEGVSGDAMTREFQQRAGVLGGIVESSLQRNSVPKGAKGPIGAAVGALITLGSEKAIGPLIDLLTHFLTRDKKASIKVKIADKELAMEFANMGVTLDDLRCLLLDVLKR